MSSEINLKNHFRITDNKVNLGFKVTLCNKSILKAVFSSDALFLRSYVCSEHVNSFIDEFDAY